MTSIQNPLQPRSPLQNSPQSMSLIPSPFQSMRLDLSPAPVLAEVTASAAEPPEAAASISAPLKVVAPTSEFSVCPVTTKAFLNLNLSACLVMAKEAWTLCLPCDGQPYCLWTVCLSCLDYSDPLWINFLRPQKLLLTSLCSLLQFCLIHSGGSRLHRLHCGYPWNIWFPVVVFCSIVGIFRPIYSAAVVFCTTMGAIGPFYTAEVVFYSALVVFSFACSALASCPAGSTLVL